MSRPGGTHIPFSPKISQATWDNIFNANPLKDKDKSEELHGDGNHGAGEALHPHPEDER